MSDPKHPKRDQEKDQPKKPNPAEYQGDEEGGSGTTDPPPTPPDPGAGH